MKNIALLLLTFFYCLNLDAQENKIETVKEVILEKASKKIIEKMGECKFATYGFRMETDACGSYIYYELQTSKTCESRLMVVSFVKDENYKTVYFDSNSDGGLDLTLHQSEKTPHSPTKKDCEKFYDFLELLLGSN